METAFRATRIGDKEKQAGKVWLYAHMNQC